MSESAKEGCGRRIRMSAQLLGSVYTLKRKFKYFNLVLQEVGVGRDGKGIYICIYIYVLPNKQQRHSYLRKP